MLPFAALHDGQRYMIERFAFATAPGLTMLNSAEARKGTVKVLLAGMSEPGDVVEKLTPNLESAMLPVRVTAASLRLRLVPQRVHLGERRALERTALRCQRALDIGKTALEFGVGAAQRGFRIGADMPRQIDQREQEVAGFFREFVGVAAVERRLDLVGLFADLVQHRARIVPVEADASRPCAAIPSRASARVVRP